MKAPTIPSLIYRLLILLFWSVSQSLSANQLPNLPDTPTADRFALTDIAWPANPGEASVCLWADDKLAALTLTVDDNTQPDIAWWLQKSETYGFPVTWFVVTGNVNSGNSYGGTWTEFSSLVDAGHDVQSHTVNHLNTSSPTWIDMNTEYRDSQLAIQANIPDHAALFLAYPGGPNQNLNDRTLADDYYASARGTAGAINRVNRIDYLNVYAMSVANIGNTAAPWSDLNNLFVPSAAAQFRGWAVLIYHKVNDQAAVQPVFDFTQTHNSKLWLGAYGDVAKYGQERDTATLSVISATASRIVFMLTDQMMDSRFDFPLTVKVRLPSDWTTVSASQNGHPVEAAFVTHEGVPYALVKAVPDRGPTIVTEIALPPMAASLAQESFDYPATTNVASSPDTASDYGFTGVNWAGSSNDIVAPGLTHSFLPASGNALQVSSNGNSSRYIDMTAMPSSFTQIDPDGVTRIGKAGATVWVRFLIRADAPDAANTGTASLQLFGASGGGTQKLAFGDLGANLNWGIARRNYPTAPDVYSANPIVTGSTTLLVARIKFVAGANNDEVDLFVNPPLDGNPPATPSASMRSVDVSTFDRININGNRLASVDEIVVAADWLGAMGIATPPPFDTTTAVTSNGVTWTFSEPRQVGTFVNGDPWVIGPVTITSITNNLNDPAFTPKLGQNGSMLNPVTTTKQGYEPGVIGSTYNTQTYLASLNVGRPNAQPLSATNPLTINAHNTLVSAVSWLYNSDTDREPGCPGIQNGAPRSALRSAGVLTVLDAFPPADAFRPAYCGTDKTIRFRASQLDYSKLPVLSMPSGVTPPAFASLADSFSKTWLDHGNTWIGAYVHPTLHMPNYGRDMSVLVGDATLRLFTDGSARGLNADKDRLVIGLVQYGIDSTGVADNGGGWPADGGIGMGRKWPILLAGSLLNDAHMLDVGHWPVRFQENEQHFVVTQTEVDITNSSAWAPDTRAPTTPYTTADIGKPEWGIRHVEKPTADNAHYNATYREINGAVTPAFALAARHMNLKTAWNHDAFFDYADRYMLWRLSEAPTANKPSPFLVAMWNSHRSTAP